MCKWSTVIRQPHTTHQSIDHYSFISGTMKNVFYPLGRVIVVVRRRLRQYFCFHWNSIVYISCVQSTGYTIYTDIYIYIYAYALMPEWHGRRRRRRQHALVLFWYCHNDTYTERAHSEHTRWMCACIWITKKFIFVIVAVVVIVIRTHSLTFAA